MKLFIIILLFVVILYLIFKKKYEGFEDKIFEIYVISMKNEDRLKNIKEQEVKIDQPITIFDAVKGDELDLDKLINNGTLIQPDYLNKNPKQKKREIGCYLSHYRIYEKIKPNSNYTIIFEDDFVIDTDNFLNKVRAAIDKLDQFNIDFDILFLGNHSSNTNHGVSIADNLYKVGHHEGLGGTQGYVVRNKNVNKLIIYSKHIDYTIDAKIQNMADKGSVNVISIYPYYVIQSSNPSTIEVL